MPNRPAFPPLITTKPVPVVLIQVEARGETRVDPEGARSDSGTHPRTIAKQKSANTENRGSVRHYSVSLKTGEQILDRPQSLPGANILSDSGSREKNLPDTQRMGLIRL